MPNVIRSDRLSAFKSQSSHALISAVPDQLGTTARFRELEQGNRSEAGLLRIRRHRRKITLSHNETADTIIGQGTRFTGSDPPLAIEDLF